MRLTLATTQFHTGTRTTRFSPVTGHLRVVFRVALQMTWGESTGRGGGDDAAGGRPGAVLITPELPMGFLPNCSTRLSAFSSPPVGRPLMDMPLVLLWIYIHRFVCCLYPPPPPTTGNMGSNAADTAVCSSLQCIQLLCLKAACVRWRSAQQVVAYSCRYHCLEVMLTPFSAQCCCRSKTLLLLCQLLFHLKYAGFIWQQSVPPLLEAVGIDAATHLPTSMEDMNTSDARATPTNRYSRMSR